MKTSMQLKAKTRNLSATSGIPPHIIQRNYFLERFLERLSLSSYKNSIVIKGGVLITSILGTAGDVITPSPIEYGYKLMFEDREISVLAYNLETVLAEKFIAVLSFDVVNSRMKDFYDIHMLVSWHGGSVSQDVFTEALRNTAGQRQMLRYIEQAGEIIDTIAGNPAMSDLWKRYSATNQYAAEIDYDRVISALRILTQWVAASSRR